MKAIIIFIFVLLSFQSKANDFIDFKKVCSTSPTGNLVLYKDGTAKLYVVDLRIKKRIYEFDSSSNYQILEWMNDSSFVVSTPEGAFSYIKKINFYDNQTDNISMISTMLLDSVLKFDVLIPQIVNIKESLKIYFVNNEEELYSFDLLTAKIEKVFSFQNLGIPIQLCISSKGNFLVFTIIEEQVGHLYLLNLNNLCLNKLLSSEEITYDSYIYSLKSENIIGFYLYEKEGDTLNIIRIVFYDIIKNKLLCELQMQKDQYPSLIFDFPTVNSILVTYFTKDIKETKTSKINIEVILNTFWKSIESAYLNMNFMIINYKDCLYPQGF